MSLHGKGFFIWRIPYTENGNIDRIIETAQQADLGHVLIKVANAEDYYNYDFERNIDLVKPLANAFKQAGITVWGWHYIIGENPLSEAQVSVQRIRELDLEGFVVNAEKEFKTGGMDAIATTYMKELRRNLGNRYPIALSSYRFPYYHPTFPFKEFMDHCDLNMPQVYWQDAHNPVYQLTKSIHDFQSFDPVLPIIPTGAAYPAGRWEPTPEDVSDFLRAVQDMNLPATNFWSWEHSRRYIPEVWDEITNYPWSSSEPEPDIAEKYIEALNSGDPLNPTLLYTLTGIHSSPTETVQGSEKLLSWYHTFLTATLPNARFVLTGYSGSSSTRQLTWTATSDRGQVLNGSDTMGVEDGKITFHYTFFTVTP
jgi:hypothetical protein